MENSVDDFDETVDLIKSHIDITDIWDYGVILLPGISIYDIFDENSALNEEIQFDESIILTNNLDQQVGELHKVRLFKKKIIILEETVRIFEQTLYAINILYRMNYIHILIINDQRILLARQFQLEFYLNLV